MGILIAMVGMFLRAPITAYTDAASRADLTDVADTALRRMARDLRQALPNSIRVNADQSAIEFLHVRTGGRYRMVSSGAATAPACPDDNPTLADDDVLDFTRADTCFKTLGNILDRNLIVNTDFLAVYNLGVAGADAYESGNATGGNKALISTTSTSGSEDRITFASRQFQLSSPSGRFQIIDTPISYVCAAGTLTRFWGYNIAAAQPAAPGGSSAVLANNVTDCSFEYATGGSQRNGLLSMRLVVTQNGESVNLYHEVHVDNAP
jgi:MSHA biogenesis protein MshO